MCLIWAYSMGPILAKGMSVWVPYKDNSGKYIVQVYRVYGYIYLWHSLLQEKRGEGEGRGGGGRMAYSINTYCIADWAQMV